MEKMDSLFPLEDDRKSKPVGKRLPVLLPLALDQIYDYACPPDLDPELDLMPGQFVLVPFGRQKRIGCVWHDRGEEGGNIIDDSRLKSIISALDVPPLPLSTLKFIDWIAGYTLAERGMTLKMFMSAKQIFEDPKPRIGVSRVGHPPSRMTEARTRVLDLMKEGEI